MIRGKKRSIEEPKTSILNAALNASIHNRFDIEVIDSKTGEIKKKAYAENVICQSLWELIALGVVYFDYINFGSGSGTPSASDTALFASLGQKSSSIDARDNDPEHGIYYVRKKIVLGDSEYNGSVLTEVGISYTYRASIPLYNNICTHAMIKDMNGNEITIAKTDTDIINIYATIYVHYNPNGYSNGSIKFIPEQTPLLDRLAGISTPNIYCDLVGNNRYTAQNKQLVTVSMSNNRMTWSTRIKVGDYNNVGGLTQVQIGGLLIDVGGEWYEGTNIVGESIGTGDGETTNFCTEFLFPSNTRIYVDGVLSDATVDAVTPVSKSGDVSAWILDLIDSESTPENIIFLNPEPRQYTIVDGHFHCIPAHRSNVYFYNRYYDRIGITEFSGSYYSSSTSYMRIRLYASNDMVNWTNIGYSDYGLISISEEFQHYKFFKVNDNSESGSPTDFAITNTTRFHNIHFTTPPPQGAVITADYFTPTIAKDEHHVFDLTVEVTFNEYDEN